MRRPRLSRTKTQTTLTNVKLWGSLLSEGGYSFNPKVVGPYERENLIYYLITPKKGASIWGGRHKIK